MSKKMKIMWFTGVLIVIGIFAYYPVKIFLVKSMVRKPPMGWYIYPPPDQHFSLKDRKENQVVQWLQRMPVQVYPMGYRYESPYTFDEWLEQGQSIKELEDTLLSLYLSQYRSLLQSNLSAALKQYGTQKSIDFFGERLIEHEWTKEAKNEMHDILYGIVNDEIEFFELLKTIEREKSLRLSDPNFLLF